MRWIRTSERLFSIPSSWQMRLTYVFRTQPMLSNVANLSPFRIPGTRSSRSRMSEPTSAQQIPPHTSRCTLCFGELPKPRTHPPRALVILTPGQTGMQSSTNPTTAEQKTTPIAVSWSARLGLLRSLQRHAGGARASWDWLRENWDLLFQHRKNGGINNNAFYPASLAGLATKGQLDEVQRFFADKTDEVCLIKSLWYHETQNLMLTLIMIDSRLNSYLLQAVDDIRTKAQFVEADREDLFGLSDKTRLLISDR